MDTHIDVTVIDDGQMDSEIFESKQTAKRTNLFNYGTNPPSLSSKCVVAEP